MKKRVLALLLASVMVFSLSACGGSKTEEPEQSPESGTEEKAPEEGGYKDTIVYSLDASPTGDFLSVQSGSDYNTSVMCAIHSALLVADPEGNLEDYLAESHEISEDGTVITFHLHDNAYFSDGEKVTADDVAFTLTYMCCPEAENWADSSTMIKGAAAYHAGETDSVEGIKVIDENTVEFTLEQYYPNALPFIGMMGIIPEHIWKDIPYSEIENHRELLGENTVGCGPYHVIENVDGEYVKLEASDNFFLGDVATKYFIFKVTNADSVTTELKTGTIDVAAVTNLLKAEIDQVDNEGFDIKYFPYDLVQSMKFNSSDTNATPAPVRLAFRYGIDIMKNLGLEPNVIRAGKANLFLSPLFRSTLATLCGSKIELYNTDGSLGAARGAALGAGFYKTPEEAFATLTKVDEILPEPEWAEALEAAYQNWKKELERHLDK